jgi:DNA-binding response OmpR family regulator
MLVSDLRAAGHDRSASPTAASSLTRTAQGDLVLLDVMLRADGWHLP